MNIWRDRKKGAITPAQLLSLGDDEEVKAEMMSKERFDELVKKWSKIARKN